MHTVMHQHEDLLSLCRSCYLVDSVCMGQCGVRNSSSWSAVSLGLAKGCMYTLSRT